MGGAATIVGMRAMKLYGYEMEAVALRNGVEAFAFPIKFNGRKNYFFGKLPIADAFITWAQGPYNKESTLKNTDYNWRTTFNIYSAIAIMGIISLLIVIWRKKF